MFSEDYRYVGNELKPVPVLSYTKWARWSEKEKHLLKDAYIRQNKTMQELSNMFARPIRSIEAQLRKMNCRKIPDWAPEDEKYLKENYSKVSVDQLTVILKKSKNAIRIKKHRLCTK